MTQNDILKVLLQVPQGSVMPLSAIQDLVQSQLGLTAVDLHPHTTTRATNYPKWKHKTQWVLTKMKNAGKIIRLSAAVYQFV